MIAAYSPQARGRSERFFRTLQDRLPKELALAEITEMTEANVFLKRSFWPRFNNTFMVEARETGDALVPLLNTKLDEIFCLHAERQVRSDNCIDCRGQRLQIPQDQVRRHYIKATVKVHEYDDGACAIFHGPRRLADYDNQGQQTFGRKKVAA